MLLSPLRLRALPVCAVLLIGLAPGCEDEPRPKTAASVDPAEQARIDQGKKVLHDANEALNERNYDRARKLLKQAFELNNESQRFEIEEAQEKLDKRQAKLWSNEVDEAFKNKDCPGAFKQLGDPLKTLSESETFVRELRRLVADPALKCVQDRIDQKTMAGALGEARKIPQEPGVLLVLGPNAAKKASAELEATIEEALRQQIAPDVKARKWTAAVDKIDAVQKRGDATEEEAEALLTVVRDAATPELAAMAAKAVGQRDAPAALKQIDQTAKALRWAISTPGQVQTGAVLPDDLAKKRDALAVWVEVQRLAVRPLTKPEIRFTHGAVQVSPAWASDSASKQEIPHGTKVWILGAAKDKALVITVDPGTTPMVQLLDKVAGWASASHLVKDDTRDWLVPDDQLKGQRVWGPLRPPDPLWELGVVVDVNGRDITVQRLADGVNQKLTRQKLRSGRLSPGTKVITFCVAQGQPAQVVEVPPSARTAKLKCDGGQEKEEDLSSLRSKPELLPPTR